VTLRVRCGTSLHEKQQLAEKKSTACSAQTGWDNDEDDDNSQGDGG